MKRKREMDVFRANGQKVHFVPIPTQIIHVTMLCGKFKTKGKEKEVFVYEQYAPSRKLKIQDDIYGKITDSDSACDLGDRASTLSAEPVSSSSPFRESGYSSGSYNPSANSSDGVFSDIYSPASLVRGPNLPSCLMTPSPGTDTDQVSDIYQNLSLYSGAPAQIMPGNLRIALYVNHGLLTVHVVEATQLRSRSGNKCNSFVKVGLIPDRDLHASCQTSIKHENSNPLFDDKFTFEIREEDKKSRLLISVWNMFECNCEFLGCMSFGLRHLQSKRKDVSGWYHLLSQSAGTRKHLQVSTAKSNSDYGSSLDMKITQPGPMSLKVIVSRSPEGFGFSVVGYNPVRVGRVSPRSPAVIAGLCTGDSIVSINGQNVSKATADVVANVIMNARGQILLEIYRSEDKENRSPVNPVYNTIEEESGIYEQLSVVTDTQSLHQAGGYHQFMNPALVTRDAGGFYGSLPHQMGPGSLHGSSHSLQNIYPTYHGNQHHMATGCQQKPFPYYMTRNGAMYSSLPVTRRSKQGYVPMSTPTRSSGHADPQNTSVMKEQWVDFGPPTSERDESAGYAKILSDRTNHVKSTTNSQHGKNSGRTSSLYGGLLPMKTPLPAIEEDLCDCSVSESDHQTRSYKSCKSYKSCTDHCGGFTSQEDVNTDYLSVSNSDSLERITPLPDITQSLENLLLPNQRMKRAVEGLIICEESFVKQMSLGIQQYSRPLRHCVITNADHQALFQNIEKLVAISECHVNQLKGKGSPIPDPQESVGAMYQPRLSIMCEAYQKYSANLQHALNLLQHLQEYPDFHHFIKKSSVSELSLDFFLNKPIKHFQLLMMHFSKLLQITPCSHHDYDALKSIVNALRNTANIARISPVPMSCSTPVRSPTPQNGTSPVPQSPCRKSFRSPQSVDGELENLESRLVFPSHVAGMDIAVPDRHIIFTSHMYMAEDSKWTKVWAILLSDMLLLTKEDDEDRLVVIQTPIQLEYVLNVDNTAHPTELVLVTREQNRYGTLSSKKRRLVLRATSLEQKCVWKTLIDQRSKSVLQQTRWGTSTSF